MNGLSRITSAATASSSAPFPTSGHEIKILPVLKQWFFAPVGQRLGKVTWQGR